MCMKKLNDEKIFFDIIVSYKRIYVHEVLANRLVKLAQEKVCGFR